MTRRSTILLGLLGAAIVAALWAADPAQPKVGGTPVLNAINGYGGSLTIRTQLDVGYAGQQGDLSLYSTDTNLVADLAVGTDGTLQLSLSGTNTLGIGPTGQLVWSATNSLARSGTDLTYTNAGNAVGLLVQNGAAHYTKVGLNSAGQSIVTSDDGSGISMTANQLVPLGGTTQDLGNSGSGTKWRDGAFSRDVYVYRHVVWNGSTNTVFDAAGVGSPEGVVTASPGSTYRNYSGGAGTTFWVKESGSGNTGWIGK